MYNVNPIELIQQIRNGQNPQQLMLGILEKQASSTPMGQNLLALAKNGKTNEIEKIARNIANQKGVDYDEAFNAFKRMLGLK